MTAIDDDELRGWLDRATKGQWVLREKHYCFQIKRGGQKHYSVQVDYGDTSTNIPNYGTKDEAAASAALMVQAPALAREVLALRADNLRLTQALAETEALEMQHGAVIERLTRELATARDDALKEAASAALGLKAYTQSTSYGNYCAEAEQLSGRRMAMKAVLALTKESSIDPR